MKHTEEAVKASLRKKNDVNVTREHVEVLSDTVFVPKLGKSIPNPRKRNDLGNGSWGKIDFLCHHCGYTQIFVNQF